jgi:hypothetical protein
MTYKIFNEEIRSAVAAVFGIFIGRFFTLISESKLNQQNDIKEFKNKYPSRIKNLDLVIQEMNYLIEKRQPYRRLLLIISTATNESKLHIDDNVFSKVMDMSEKVDECIYEEMRVNFRDSYLNKFKEAIEFYSTKEIDGYDELMNPRFKLSKEAEQNLNNLSDSYIKDITKLRKRLLDYRTGLQIKFNNC